MPPKFSIFPALYRIVFSSINIPSPDRAVHRRLPPSPSYGCWLIISNADSAGLLVGWLIFLATFSPLASVWVLGGGTECPLQVCQLSRHSLSTHFLRRDLGLLYCTRALDDFWERRYVPPFYFLTIPNRKRQPYIRKPAKLLNSDKYRFFAAVS